MAAFEYRQAQEIRDVFARHGVRYLFIGKAGAILLGFPDTTQDADVFAERTAANGQALVSSLRELGFGLSDVHAAEIGRGKDFVQLKNGPFDLDLIFAPDGIESFEGAWRRWVEIEGSGSPALPPMLVRRLLAQRLFWRRRQPGINDRFGSRHRRRQPRS